MPGNLLESEDTQLGRVCCRCGFGVMAGVSVRAEALTSKPKLSFLIWSVPSHSGLTLSPSLENTGDKGEVAGGWSAKALRSSAASPCQLRAALFLFQQSCSAFNFQKDP